MRFGLALIRTLVGAAFGAVAAVALAPALMGIGGDGDRSIVLVAVAVGSAILGFFAPTVRRAFGRGFLLAGVSFLVLPIGAFLLSGRVASNLISTAEEGSEAAVAIGSGLTGMAVTGVATFVGLLLAAIFIVVGLVLSLGGRREVVVVVQPGRQDPPL